FLRGSEASSTRSDTVHGPRTAPCQCEDVSTEARQAARGVRIESHQPVVPHFRTPCIEPALGRAEKLYPEKAVIVAVMYQFVHEDQTRGHLPEGVIIAYLEHPDSAMSAQAHLCGGRFPLD